MHYPFLEKAQAPRDGKTMDRRVDDEGQCDVRPITQSFPSLENNPQKNRTPRV